MPRQVPSLTLNEARGLIAALRSTGVSIARAWTARAFDTATEDLAKMAQSDLKVAETAVSAVKNTH